MKEGAGSIFAGRSFGASRRMTPDLLSLRRLIDLHSLLEEYSTGKISEKALNFCVKSLIVARQAVRFLTEYPFLRKHTMI